MEKEPTEREASGMTVNERLWRFGLIEDFDEAVAQKDEPRLKSILEKIYLTPENIQVIFEKYLKY